jgi:hypothetical protein
MTLPIYSTVVYGAHSGTIGDHAFTGGFTVTSNDAVPVTVIGESDVLTDYAIGGGNIVFAEGELATAIGDAQTVSGYVRAGHNTVTSEARGESDAAGDAITLGGYAVAGHNTVTADSSDGPAVAFGDALTMTDYARGGYNTVAGNIGLGGLANLFGDAYTLSGHASGGHNTITGSAAGPETTFNMYGDAYQLTDYASGGGNTLISPGFPVIPTIDMFGDGHDLLGHASGGGNTLVAGQGVSDIMWGDAAVVSALATTRANTFVFSAGIGHDAIMDFRSGEDHIDLQGFGVSNFQQLSQLFTQTTSGLDIVFSSSSDILLHGVTHVSAGDFVFS